jgi:hypothetical protein
MKPRYEYTKQHFRLWVTHNWVVWEYMLKMRFHAPHARTG